MSSYHSIETLPVPDTDQVAHSTQLVEFIVERIEAAGGVIPFSDYMQACLYRPGLGYYSAGSIKFGAQGDFVTAPELSPFFGQCLGNRAAQLFAAGLGASILEFGAGSGRLCRDLLRRLDALGQTWDRYLILETSADLRQRQQTFLEQQLTADQFSRLQWLDQLPRGFDGLLIGNEVLDAMPVNVVLKDRGWHELGVGFDGSRLTWQVLSEATEATDFIHAIDADDTLPRGYCTEVNLNYLPWCKALAQACNRVHLLLIDYGYERAQYYHPARSTGTLMCFYRHRAHPDPFVYPGLQDITAFVDFDAFADAAESAGFDIDGLHSQARFLLDQGLLELAANADDSLQSAQQVKQLTLPGEMGEKFKLIELSLDQG